MCDLANTQVFIYMKFKNSFITDLKSFCLVIVLGALYHTEVSNKLVFLSSVSYFQLINKIGKIDTVD